MQNASSDPIKRVELIITGKVQGVWFRYETQQAAISMGVRGYVENMPDSTVHAVAEGDDGQLGRFVEFCGKGPPLARVGNIDTTWSEATGEFDGFSIRR